MSDSDSRNAAGPLDPGLPDRLSPVFRVSQVGGCVSSVAHDVNNHLGAILAYAELLQQGPDLGDEARRMMGNIIKSVHKCSGLVSTITAVARKEKAEVNMIAVPDFLDQTLDLKRYDFRTARVALDLECPEDMPSLIVDRPKLMMALLCLLMNALEAVEGAQKPAVKVAAEATEAGVEIAVKDSGPGVAPKVGERMFDAFYTTKAAPHLGLGLTLARENALYHQGELHYSEQRGFVLSIPLATGLKI